MSATVKGMARRIDFSWLITLRWAAIAGQLATTLIVHFGLGVALPLAWVLGLIGFAAATNLVAVVGARGREVPEWAAFAVMALDVIILTALLYLTGGPFNPFSILYLVQIALAAVALRARYAWPLAALAVIGSGVLFLDHRELPLPARTHADHMRWHLQGMWVAFGVAAGFIVYFLVRVTRLLARREAELLAARDLAARHEKLASLAALAAGAAHELGSPLATIAVVARELERRAAGDVLDDVKLVRQEVERCRQILSQMSKDAGTMTGESPHPVAARDLVAAALEGAAAQPAVRVELGALGARAVRVPRHAIAQALGALVKNAQDASQSEVVVRAHASGDNLEVEVEDTGTGMTPEVLARAGEPFFTTKEPGRGMGLGLFLARAVAEQSGGGLAIESTPGRGTRVRMRLPVEPAATIDRMAP